MGAGAFSELLPPPLGRILLMWRDLLALLCAGCLLALAMSYAGRPRLRRAWHYPLSTSAYANRAFPREDERLPSPLIIDLDGDGSNEIVLVTREPKLVVLSSDGQTLEEEFAEKKSSWRVIASLSLLVFRGPAAVGNQWRWPQDFDAYTPPPDIGESHQNRKVAPESGHSRS